MNINTVIKHTLAFAIATAFSFAGFDYILSVHEYETEQNEKRVQSFVQDVDSDIQKGGR